jgi:UDP-N-acetylmuramoyl-L-alanyl-D-glutamate--2,6-diaminopimelate ligase
MRSLETILKGIEIVSITGNQNIDIQSVCFDSRETKSGDLFVAVKGTRSDGHNYLSSVVEKGAVAIICEKIPVEYNKDICWIVTRNSAAALGIAASNYFGSPSSLLKLVGVTGTNGKTTVATLLYDLFRKLGYPSGLISTVANFVDGAEIPATHTTPNPIELNQLLAEMVTSGCEFAFMEVSSHAIDQDRIAGLSFTGGVYTNLTHDHLDYHKTYLNYINAKKRFFDQLPESAFALINGDDKNGAVMVQNCNAQVKRYSLKSMSDFMGKIVEQSFEGMQLRIGRDDLMARFIGEFNAYNLMAVYATAELLGGAPLEIMIALSALKPVQGRLEVIQSKEGIIGIVDYAHTPDALENVIGTLNRLREPGIKLITVVGAGGDRDKTKRPEMARICAEGSDRVILTSDNPRSEDPTTIIEEMVAGINQTDIKRVLKIGDRREAIRTAVMMAKEADLILVAGKGHETYQEVNGKRSHFDDREELKSAFGIE